MLGQTVRLRTSIIQQKTGRPVPFELTDPRGALIAWLRRHPAEKGDWLFPSRSRPGDHVTTRQYRGPHPACSRQRHRLSVGAATAQHARRPLTAPGELMARVVRDPRHSSCMSSDRRPCTPPIAALSAFWPGGQHHQLAPWSAADRLRTATTVVRICLLPDTGRMPGVGATDADGSPLRGVLVAIVALRQYHSHPMQPVEFVLSDAERAFSSAHLFIATLAYFAAPPAIARRFF